MLEADGVDYHVMIEPQEFDAYASVLGEHRCIALPENDQGLVYSRNHCKEHSVSIGAERHWQFDDDIGYLGRLHKGYRIRCDAGIAITAADKFCDRYENIGLYSFNSEGFLPCNGSTQNRWPPFYLNSRCYTVFCMLNSLPNKWRYRYNEDTDMTLQVLAAGYCTVLFNAFYMKTGPTNYGGKVSKVKGGQQSVYADDGRLKMSRVLERQWPGIVETKRRFGRPQHKVKSNWTKFDTKLIRKKDIDWESLEKAGPDNHGLELQAVSDVKSPGLKQLLNDQNGVGFRHE